MSSIMLNNFQVLVNRGFQNIFFSKNISISLSHTTNSKEASCPRIYLSNNGLDKLPKGGGVQSSGPFEIEYIYIPKSIRTNISQSEKEYKRHWLLIILMTILFVAAKWAIRARPSPATKLIGMTELSFTRTPKLGQHCECQKTSWSEMNVMSLATQLALFNDMLSFVQHK